MNNSLKIKLTHLSIYEKRLLVNITMAFLFLFFILNTAFSDDLPPVWEEVPSNWYTILKTENPDEAKALSTASKIAKDRVTVYQNVDGWTIRVPKGESCSEAAIDLAGAFMGNSDFKNLTPGWEVHNVSGPVGALSHSTTVLVPPKPAGWKPGDPYRAYVVDNYTGTVGVEPVTGYWDTENQNTYYSFPPRPYGVNPPTSLVRSFFNINTYGAEKTKLTQLGGIANYDNTPSGKSGVKMVNKEGTWEVLPAEQPLSIQLKKYQDSAPNQGNQIKVQSRESIDPNVKVGPAGNGLANYVDGLSPMAYTVSFENKPEATAHAQIVTIDDQLNTSVFDLETFRFGPVTVMEKTLMPPGLPMKKFTGDIDLRPDQNIVVRVDAELSDEGMLQWVFSSLNADTMEPLEQDDIGGFLPPGKEGSVSINIMPAPSLTHGTELNNFATIYFDNNLGIQTNTWNNKIDKQAPESHVNAMPGVVYPISKSFNINWTGSDPESGINRYFIFVSIDGGEYQSWLSNVEKVSAYFECPSYGVYRFYSVAMDHAGNMEQSPEQPDATVRLLPSGDVDHDGDIDKNDLAIIQINKNKSVSASTCGQDGDLDWDGKITILDARLMVTRFTRPGGAVQ